MSSNDIGTHPKCHSPHSVDAYSVHMLSLPRAPHRLPRRLTSSLAAGVLAALVLTSCGDDAGDSGDDAVGADPSSAGSSSATAPPSASSAESTTPQEVTSAPPSPTGSDPTGSASDSPVDDLFLTAEEMPGLNDATAWTEEGTEPEQGSVFGDCARFTLVDSGAEDAWIRVFTAEGQQKAAQLIATFADAKSAWRAEQTLRGWHRDCAEQIDAEVTKVNPIQPVKVASGKAFTYLVQYGKKGAEVHHFNGVAVNRNGKRLSVVLINNEGQDYNYASGREPAQRAARAVAEKLG